MNIVQLQEALKDFSDDQLVREMQAPSGQAPQYLVLTELERREKSRQRYQAQQQPQQSVAEEALMSRMQGGIAPMAPQGMPGMPQAMPQESANAPMQPPMSPPMTMAQGGVIKAQQGMYMGGRNSLAYGDNSFSEQINQQYMPAQNEQESQAIFDYLNRQSEIDRAMQERMNQFGSASMTPSESSYLGVDPRTVNISSQSMYRTPGMASGGVVKARKGIYMPEDPLLRAIMMQESRGDPMARGAAGEVGAFQIMPATALQPGFGIPTLFPELAAQIGPNKQFATPQEAYEANKDIIDAVLQDPRQSEQFASSYIDAARQRFPGDEARAIAAYNVGMGGAEKLENPLAFPYVEGVASQGYSPEELKTAPSIPGISAAQASTPQPPSVGADKATATPQQRWEFLSKRPPGALDVEERAELFDLTKQFGRFQPETKTEGLGSPDLNKFLQENILDPFQENIGAPIEGLIERAGEGISSFIEDPVGVMMESTVSPENFAAFQERRAVEQAEAQGDATRRPGGPSGMAADAEARRQAENERASAQEAALYDQAQAPETETTAEQPQSALEMYMDMLKEQRAGAEKQAEMDRYLALAQAGATLASSKDPTFLGALGEATGAGIEALRGARKPVSDLQEAERDFMKSLAVAEASAESKGATTQREYLRLAKDYDKMIADMQGDIIGTPTPEQAQRLQEALSMRDYYRTLGGLPPIAPTGGASGISVDAIAAELARRQQ